MHIFLVLKVIEGTCPYCELFFIHCSCRLNYKKVDFGHLSMSKD
jgi:hypothetical protein